MLFNCPLSLEKAKRLVGALGVARGDQVLDAGCGRGEFLIRLVESTGADGLGLDVDEVSIAAAKAKLAERLPNAVCEFRQADLRQVALDEGAFDAAICIAATHAFAAGEAAFPTALDKLARCVRPGGRLLIGEGYWKRPPDDEYLQLIGEPVGIYRDHRANAVFAEDRGLTCLYAAVSSDDEWDHFEWSHRMKIESEAAVNLDDPQLAQRRDRSRQWCDGYLRWGRSTMGFGFYVLQKPKSA